MKRIICNPIPPLGTRFEPSKSEQQHLAVRRVKQGEQVELLDGRGQVALAQVELLNKRQIVLCVQERLDARRQMPLALTMLLGLPSHPATVDAMLPGLVQIGVQRVVLQPVQYSGTPKKGEKWLRRLETIAAEALKQSGRLYLPSIEWSQQPWPQTCAALAAQHLPCLILHPGQNGQGHLEAFRAQQAGLIAIGPEGGFTAQEIQQAVSAGFCPWDLGPGILKMETAAIGAAFWAMQQVPQ